MDSLLSERWHSASKWKRHMYTRERAGNEAKPVPVSATILIYVCHTSSKYPSHDKGNHAAKLNRFGAAHSHKYIIFISRAHAVRKIYVKTFRMLSAFRGALAHIQRRVSGIVARRSFALMLTLMRLLITNGQPERANVPVEAAARRESFSRPHSPPEENTISRVLSAVVSTEWKECDHNISTPATR